MTDTIRPLVEGDRAEWEVLWKAYLAFYATELPQTQIDLHFNRLIAAEGPFQALVAERDGCLAGIVHYLFHGHGWYASEVCYMQDLFVDPTFRRRGIARSLIHGVYEAADRQGAANVYWMTQTFNETARRIYDKAGRVTPFIKYQRV